MHSLLYVAPKSLGVIWWHIVTEQSTEASNEGPYNLVYIFNYEKDFVCTYQYLTSVCSVWGMTNCISENI